MGLFTSKWEKKYDEAKRLNEQLSASFIVMQHSNAELKDKLETFSKLYSDKEIEFLKERELNIEMNSIIDNQPDYEEVILTYENKATIAELKEFSDLRKQLAEEAVIELTKNVEYDISEDTSFNITIFTHTFKYFKLKKDGNN